MSNLTKSTRAIKASDIKRSWYLFNAKGKVLGRLASNIALCLIGKRKPMYVPYLDVGDYGVVINAKDIVLTGKKSQQKWYATYSGYPGGLRKLKVGELLEKRPEKVVEHAVSGMLPKNKLRSKRIRRLFVYKDDKHPHVDKFKSQTSNVKEKK